MTAVPDPRHAYKVREVADKIAHGHSWKHVENGRFSGRGNQKYGPDLDIKNRAEFSKHIEKTLLDKETKVFRGIDERTGKQTRDIFHNRKTNTTVVVNRGDPDCGTCIRGDLKRESELTRLWRQDNRNRDMHGLERAEISQDGGYKALYPGHEMQTAILPDATHEAEIGQGVEAARPYSPDDDAAEISAEHSAREAREAAQHNNEHDEGRSMGR